MAEGLVQAKGATDDPGIGTTILSERPALVAPRILRRSARREGSARCFGFFQGLGHLLEGDAPGSHLLNGMACQPQVLRPH
jgi:hypothetical protein